VSRAALGALRVRHRTLSVHVRCSAGAGCHIRLLVQARGTPLSGGKRGTAGQTIARVEVALAGGGAEWRAIAFNRAGAALLRRSRALHVQLLLEQRLSGAFTKISTRTATL
jgi:hypothetical protein